MSDIPATTASFFASTGSLEAAQRSTRLAFFVAGFGGAAWASLVVFAKLRVGIGDGTLGLLLLCLGAGSMISMPLTGAWTARYGCRRVITVAGLLISVTLPLLASVSSLPMLVAALFCFGAGIGSVDCAVNIQALIIERASGRAMMSGFHGLFSVGGILGAAGVSSLLTLGASPLESALCVVGVMLIALVLAFSGLLPFGTQSTGPAFAIPRGIVLFIGALCFIAFLTEGSVLDWSAVFLTALRGIRPSYSGLGYAVFAVVMTVGRLTGDAIVRRLGGVKVIVIGGLCAASGLALATLVPFWETAMIGYALIGAGCSNIVPVLYSSAGRQRTMPEHLAVPAITTLAYAGILAGPAAIGFIAHATSLSVAFLMVAVLLVGVAASGGILRDYTSP